MGLLDKTNPNATRKSLIRWAIFGAIGAPIYIVLRHWGHWGGTPLRYCCIILFATPILGAGIGALMEWQLDDGLDDPKESDDESRSKD